MRDVDGRAVLLGAATALLVCVPAAVIGQVLTDRESDAVVLPFLAVLLGLAAGGYAAARSAAAAPYTNAALAALAAFVLVQAVGVVLRVVRDDPIRVTQMVFSALIAYASGLLGGVVAVSRGARR
ncbi:MAG TPA: hypothetical protein VGB14_12840 [Acidimicrobiales bacterium]